MGDFSKVFLSNVKQKWGPCCILQIFMRPGWRSLPDKSPISALAKF